MTHSYSSISQEVKAIKTMKFVQLIEYIMRHIVLEKSYTKCGGESLRSNILSVKYTIHLNGFN